MNFYMTFSFIVVKKYKYNFNLTLSYNFLFFNFVGNIDSFVINSYSRKKEKTSGRLSF